MVERNVPSSICSYWLWGGLIVTATVTFLHRMTLFWKKRELNSLEFDFAIEYWPLAIWGLLNRQ